MREPHAASAPETLAPNRSDRRRRRTRDALVAAARRVFAARGVEAATIQEITDAADVAKGSFYNHFDSKEAVLAAVVEVTLAELTRTLDRVTAPLRADPARVLAVCMRHTLRAGVGDPTLGWFLLRAQGALPLAEAVLGPVGRRDIARGIEAARFEVDDVGLVTAMIAGSMHAVLRQRLRGELGPESDAAFTRRALRLLGIPDSEAERIAGEPLPPIDASPE